MESKLTVGRDGKVVCHSGPDAMLRVQAITLWSSLGLYQSTGIIPTRGMGITYMMNLATQITGNKYKRKEIDRARTDLKTFADEMLAALPIVSLDGVSV